MLNSEAFLLFKLEERVAIQRVKHVQWEPYSSYFINHNNSYMQILKETDMYNCHKMHCNETQTIEQTHFHEVLPSYKLANLPSVLISTKK